ncbi:hypothetical protein L9F63_001228 [Diploptera punctata]|uniref:Uncharacterized protein n=1 Tax=Diploptera punctata TaxID=6984 RepID=A0AAD8EJX3_DIPPU|nr:hypothetical protein L9F63_001228 [Diploptera punctata]
MSWNGNTDCLSWRYPTQRSDAIDIPAIMQRPSKSPCEYYVLLLELIYDRSHFLFYLLNTFLDMLPVIQDNVNLPRNVIRSQHPTLGSLVSNFWKKIMMLQQALINQSIKETLDKRENTKICNQCLTATNDISSRGVQTEMQTLLQCESCYLSESLVKQMVAIIELFGNDIGIATAVSAERLQMKEELFKITQWSAMQRWTNAIQQDLANFITTFKDLNTKNKDFLKNSKTKDLEYQTEIKKHVAKIKRLEESEKHLKLKVINYEESQIIATEKTKGLEMKVALQIVNLDNLRKQVKQLETCKCIWETEKEKLTTDLSNMKHGMENLQCEINVEKLERNNLTEKLKSTENCKNVYETELMQVKNKLKQNEKLLKSQQESYQIQNEELIQLKTSQKDTTENLQSLIKKIEREKLTLQEMTTKQQTSISQLEKRIQAHEKEKILLLAYPDINGPVYQNVVQGNPFQDMQHHLLANKLRIQILQEQNNKLQRTLDRMNKLSKAKGDSNLL